MVDGVSIIDGAVSAVVDGLVQSISPKFLEAADADHILAFFVGVQKTMDRVYVERE
jgi:hypothetical protein